MEKKLSIVIPTLNRCEYLKYTLKNILPQVERNQDRVDLVICCNASKDGTDEYVKGILPIYPFVRYKYFNEYVEVGHSLIRSVGEAKGEFVVLWGDDDIPFPYFCETVLDIIEKHPGIGVIHCNRLQGKDTKYGFRDLKPVERMIDDGEKGFYQLNEFIHKFTISLGFISSLVFRQADFLSATDCYNPEHYGYEHLGIILNGAKGKDCFYCDMPLEIQRLPLLRDYDAKWAWYCFVGIPNMMNDFDKQGLTKTALSNWLGNEFSSFPHFVWNMCYTCLDRTFSKEHIAELNKYQKSKIRKILTYLIVYMMPLSLFKTIKARMYK